MNAIDYSTRYCVIGAGSSGLTVAKNFLELGIPVDVIERKPELGGNWHFGTEGSAICRSTHLISSKGLTAYTDFSMPEDYPHYPNHTQVFNYLKDYADHFRLREVIEFSRTIETVDRVNDLWRIRLDGGENRTYAGLVIANGHNWDPRWAKFPGEFSGTQLHASQYKTPDMLAGKRVLVVGAGNSGCDIAVESAMHGERTFHSTRRGYNYMPKFVLGMPADEMAEQMLRWRAPLKIRQWSASFLAKLVLGWPQDYGLPKPDHRLLETHPIINSQLLYFVGHGDISVKPNVQKLCGDEVEFDDGSRESVDVIVYATGYKISFPFIDRKYLNCRSERPDLFLNVFHPDYDNLFVAGLIQPDGGQFGLVDYQAQLMAQFVAAQQDAPAKADRFRKQKRAEDRGLGKRMKYVDSPRHQLEIQHFPYRRTMQKLIRQLECGRTRRGIPSPNATATPS